MADIFLSHSSADNHAADTLKAWLGRDRPSWSVFLDKDPKDGILAGQGWQDKLRAELASCRLVLAIITPEWLASPWCFTEAVTADFRGKDFLPVLPKALADEAFAAAPPILNTNQRCVVDLTTEAGWRDILRALDHSGLDPDQWFAIPDSVGPYPGFVAFEERDAGVFFGRDGEITDYLAALNKLRGPGRAQALVISGGSGTGKSSLLKAGLIPRLRRRQDWCIIPPFDPSREPLHAFLASLREAALAAGSDLDLTVGADSTAETLFTAIDEAMRRLEERTKAWLLLPMDQAEVLVAGGVTEHGEEGRRLLDLVGRLLATRRRGLVAIFTIRTEFLPRLETAVPGGVRLEQKPLGGIKALADVIELPAARFGIELEPGLSSRMVEDTHGAEALPLLAYVLKELNVRFGDDKKLTMEEYTTLGGVEGAIRTKLAEALSDPPPSATETAALRRTFVRHLIRVDEQAVHGARYLRRAVVKTRLPAAAERLRDRLVEARLLVEGPDGTVAIAHERLIGNWPEAPIAGWLAADAADRRLVEALRSRLNEHGEGGPLLVSKPLLDAEDLLGRDTLLDQEEPELAAFIRHSREAERQRLTREKWQLRGAIAAAAVFLIVAAGAVWFFLEARDKTQIAEQNLATANRALASAIWNDLPEWYFDGNAALPVRSRNAIWQLAAGGSILVTAFREELSSAPDRLSRFGIMVDEIMRAISGPSGFTPEQAQVALVPVLNAISNTTDPVQLEALARAVEAFGPSPEQAQVALVRVLDAIPNTAEPFRLDELAQALVALGPSPEQARTALTLILDAITTEITSEKGWFYFYRLAQAVATLAPMLEAEQAQVALVRVLDAITTTGINSRDLMTLAQAVAALGPSPEQAQVALIPILESFFETNDAITATAVFDTLTKLADDLWALAESIAVLAPKLEAEQAQAALVPVLNAISTGTRAAQLEALAKAVAALAPKLEAEQAQVALVPVLNAITNTAEPFRLEALALAVEALEPSPEQAQVALVPVLDAFINIVYFEYEIPSWSQAVAALAPKLEAEQARMALVPVLNAITNTAEPFWLEALARAVEAFGPSPEQAQVALVPVLDAITKSTEPDQLVALAQAVAALGPSPEQARTALLPVLDAITNSTEPDQLMALARAVEALGPSPEQARTALVPVLDAITNSTERYQLVALARGARALAPKLEGPADPAESDALRSALAWAPSRDAAAALAAAYAALLPREPAKAFVTAVVTPLGFPLVAGPATDVLIEALREVGGPGKEAGLDATLAWLREAYPDIDPDAVPVCPPPPAGWEGLQCPPV